MLIDIPFIHARVRLQYVTDNEQSGFEECYVFAVTCIVGRPPLFTCHMRSGAVFSRLPLEAFLAMSDNPFTALPDRALCPWTCVGSTVSVRRHEYLKDYTVVIEGGARGKYLFTLDYTDGNYSEDPEQHKTHNVIALEDGRFAAMPNNYCRFLDSHFTVESLPVAHYRRQSEYWTAG